MVARVSEKFGSRSWINRAIKNAGGHALEDCSIVDTEKLDLEARAPGSSTPVDW
jgi:hypothetical protein